MDTTQLAKSIKSLILLWLASNNILESVFITKLEFQHIWRRFVTVGWVLSEERYNEIQLSLMMLNIFFIRIACWLPEHSSNR